MAVDQIIPTEQALSLDLEIRLGMLAEIDRCEWHGQVGMLCWIRASRSAPEPLRIDYIAKIDGLLVGFEVKAPPQKASELGKDLVQCMQYVHGIIAPSKTNRIPAEWIGQSLLAVFLVSDARYCPPYVQKHGEHAHRLFGPANVGLFNRNCRHPECFELFLSGDRVWSKEWGWHRGILNRSHRVGNGSVNMTDFSSIETPESAACPFPHENRN